MNNITLQSMLKEFSTKNSLTDKDTLSFEKFTNYSLLANDYYDSFEQESVGTGNCIGVDAIAIAISDILVYSEKTAKSLTTGQFDVCFNFVQAKTSSSLDLGDYLKFLQAIFIFFTGTESDQPQELKTAFNIKKHIYDKAAKFRSLPTLRINYVYTGDGKRPDKDFGPQIDALVKSIEAISYSFSSVENRLIGAIELQNLYKETLNRTTKPLMFQRHVALPKLSLATAAYLGVAKCKDYIDLLSNQSGGINKGIFYDNVRDYLGSTNSVNADIEKTIKSDEQRNLFSVLNNGVTIVAKKVVPSGDVFQISGFQIVNGCQTSHVLFNNKAHITDDMYITVKLIETDDIDLSSSVIKATNSQSQVMKEAFATIKPYHKRLEDFFNAMNIDGHRLFYARRPHQYDEDESVLNSEIVSAPLLIKSFVSVVLEEPHKVHFYYGQILRDYNNEKSSVLFNEEHHPGLYFLSHLIASKSKDFSTKNRTSKWSYHTAFLVKKILNINLNQHDKVNDDSIRKMVQRVDADFAQAATEALTIIKSSGFGENDHMTPEATTSILDSLKARVKLKHVAAARVANTVKTSLNKGLYRVNNFTSANGIASFSYASSQHEIPYEAGEFDSIELASCTINIEDGRLSSIVS